MGLHDLNRAQDTASSVNKLADIVPIDWPKVPSAITAAAVTPSWVRTVTFTGGAFGDDVDLSTANSTDAYSPKTQTEKAALPGLSPPNAIAGEPDFTLAVDITAPRGYIAPRDSYAKAAPAAPVITSLAPNTAVAGSPSPLSVIITGTGFTPFTTILTGGVQTPYATYVSATKMTLLMDPARSSAGIVQVIARDHSVSSAASNFTYT